MTCVIPDAVTRGVRSRAWSVAGCSPNPTDLSFHNRIQTCPGLMGVYVHQPRWAEVRAHDPRRPRLPKT